jgi:hypothetical protein
VGILKHPPTNVLEYIDKLQRIVTDLRGDRRRFRLLSFAAGFGCGCVVVWFLALVR